MTVELLTNVRGLRDAFKVLAPAMSKEATHYYLNGVCLEKKGKTTNFVAADGYKLVYININENQYFDVMDSDLDGDFKHIIPRAAIEEFIAPDKLKCALVRMTIEGNRVLFAYDRGAAIKSYKLVDGTFPEWERVIPKETSRFIGFNPKHMEQFCKSLRANEKVILECEQQKVNADGEVVELDATTSPQLIRSDKGANLIIMPMRA